MFKKLVHGLVGLAALTVIATAAPTFAVATQPEPETVFSIMGSQDSVTWGLDRVDGSLDSNYVYDDSAGAGVRIYIVDTGIDATHREFGSRVADGFDSFGENLDQTDCHGHGTHVAAIAAGSYYGVAKSATLVPVRVLSCAGLGTTTTLLDGLQWILDTHPAGTPGVVNLSLGGAKDERINAATTALVSAGLSVVSAAGNFAADACNYSPASAQGVVAVGATDNTDNRASFSNYGMCVDLFAPGLYITSANALNHSTSKSMSGTSQASPFVAGAAAILYSAGIANSPSSAEDALYADLVGTVSNGQSARDSILKVFYVEPEPLPEPQPEPPVEQIPEPIVEPEPVLPEPEPSDPPTVDDPILPEPVVTEPAPEPEPVVAEPEPVPDPVTDTNPVGDPVQVDYNLQAVQSEPGSRIGWLSWDLIEGATYKIYKTGTIRPSWRQVSTVNEGRNIYLLSDLANSLSIYKVVAVLGTQEIEMGEIKYKPTN